ncbi:hypothetical protein AKJ61_03265, partial [candidate division MSBL1 archaeon SCGC-AAA259B11]
WDPWIGVLPVLAEEGIGKICEDCQWEIIRRFPEEKREDKKGGAGGRCGRPQRAAAGGGLPRPR